MNKKEILSVYVFVFPKKARNLHRMKFILTPLYK